MNLGWKHLAGQLLNGADLSKARLEEIDILLDEYPYFAGLQFLKAAKVKAIQPEASSETYAKAALYFPNPHWFAMMLEHSVPESETYKAESTQEEFYPVQEPQEETVSHVSEPGTTESVAEETWNETVNESIPEMQEAADQSQADWEQSLAENPVFQQHQVSDEEQVEKEIWHQQATQTAETGSTEEPSTNVVSEENIPEEEILPDPVPASEWVVEETEPETAEPVLAHPEPEAEFVPETEPLPTDDVEIPKPAEPALADLDIPFEPLYTIDYFASQGIKIAAEASPKDQLSLKLRSFTEWLRAMKKLHPEKIDKDFNQDQEEQVRVIAESSNAPQLVYTEAMAEVFIKQGKKDKARQVFEKLSLLDPGKSAYFAVRIKELKEN